MARIDQNIIDSQLHAWLQEGFTHEDILAQAKHTWPEVTTEAIQGRLKTLASLGLDANNIHSLNFLQSIHLKRMKEVERLEKRLDDEKCPLSVHSLYRGLLRDAEAQCFKIIAYERQVKLDGVKRQADVKRAQHREDLAQARRYADLMKSMGHHDRVDDADDEPDHAPINRNKGKSFANFSCLLGIILAWFLASCSCLKAQASTSPMSVYRMATPYPSVAVSISQLPSPCPQSVIQSPPTHLPHSLHLELHC